MTDELLQRNETPKVTETVDSQGNMWREYPSLPHESSFLTGDSPTRIVVTRAGQRLYPDTAKFFQRLEKGKFVEGLAPLTLRGAEGVVRTVNDGPFRYATMLAPAKLDGVVKFYQGQDATPLLAHEVVQVFDAIRPAFTDQGIQLLEPYAATNRKLYSPFIRGMNLEKALGTFDTTAVRKLRSALRERAELLHYAVHEKLAAYLEEKGLVKEQDGNQLFDNIPDLYTNPYRTSEVVKMMVDLCPVKDNPNEDKISRFRNWVLPADAIKQIQGVGSVQEAVDITTSRAVVVDPVMILSGKRR